MMKAKTPETYFHMSLNVSDLVRSVAFYRDVLNLEPSKLRDGFARFTPNSPPLVLSLVQRDASKGLGGAQRLSHLGFRVDSSQALAEARKRLTDAGHELREEPGTDCCYAVQDKFWITDPDGNELEFYELLDDAGTSKESSRTACCA